MDVQTALNVVLAISTLVLGIRNFSMSTKKETQRESEEMTEIRVQYQQVLGLLRDLQKDVRTNSADFRALSERVVRLETRFDAMKKETENGRQ